MQEVQESIDDVLSRTDLSKDEKAKRSAFSCSTDAWVSTIVECPNFSCLLKTIAEIPKA